MNLRIELLIPELFLFVWSIVILTSDLFFIKKNKVALLYMTLFGFVATAVAVILIPKGEITPISESFGIMFINDHFSAFFKIVILLAGFMAVSSSYEAIKKLIEHPGEFFGLIIMSSVGMMFLASSTELISMYVALELSTIPLFILTAFQKRYLKSTEAGLKYLILGALSSALLLYGLSFLYGMTGSTLMAAEAVTLAVNSSSIHYGLTLALVLIVAGLGFKLALVPFHMWAPDVYEGAPTSIASFLSVASKAAGLAALARIMYGIFTAGTANEYWGITIAILAALAMIVGNIAAILQSNVKRLLAYSSIAQAGYIMVGFVAASEMGISSISLYIFAYLFANMGAFAVVVAVGNKLGSDKIKDYAGISKKSPFLAASMLIFLLSLAGIPPLAGFIAKYRVFMAAIQTDNYMWLVWVALATSVISMFYYVRVIKEMFITEKAEDDTDAIGTSGGWRLSFPIKMAIVVGLIGTLIVGIYPQPFLEQADKVIQSFF
jgi:NADH-quinone oxidoreductase subunit N